MREDKRITDSRRSKDSNVGTTKKSDITTYLHTSHTSKEYSAKVDAPSKVVVRRLPPSLTAVTFLEQISPILEYDYYDFVQAEMGLGQNAFSHAYISFVDVKDIWIFKEKFDGYVFLDSKGNEYPAVVEFAPFSKIPKKKSKKFDSRQGTIETDPDYLNFLENLKNKEPESVLLPEALLEEIEAKEKELKANHGCPKVITPLIEFLAKKKEEKRTAFVHAREEKKRKDLERQKQREEERRRKLERERERREINRERLREKEEKEGPIKLLKNPVRQKEKEEDIQHAAAAAGSGRKWMERVEDYESLRSMKDIDINRRSEHEQERHETSRQEKSDDKKTEENRKTDKTFGERERQKESSYGARRKQDGLQQQRYGGDRSKNYQREKEKERYNKDKVTKIFGDRDGYKGHEKNRGHEKEGKMMMKESERDDRKTVKDESRSGISKYDHRRQKESSESKYSKRSEALSYSEQSGGGKERRYDQETRARDSQRAGGESVRNKSGSSYTSSSSSSQRDNRAVIQDKSTHGNKFSDEKSLTVSEKDGSKENMSHVGVAAVRRGSCDSTASSTSDKAKSTDETIKRKSINYNETEMLDDVAPIASRSKNKNEEMEWTNSGRGNADKDSSNMRHRERIRYKDRPERAIYNPGKRATERQKETGSNR